MESKRAVNQVLSPVRPWAETRRKRGRWAGSYSSDWAAIEGPGFCFLLKIIFLAVLLLPKSSCSREVALVEYAWKLDGGWIGCNISPGGVWGAWCFMGKTRFAYKLSLEIGWHNKMGECGFCACELKGRYGVLPFLFSLWLLHPPHPHQCVNTSGER